MREKETQFEWNGFKGVEFHFEGRLCFLVFPKESREKKKWLLKTEYWNAFPKFELAMLERGYHLAYIANKSRWMVPEDIEAKAHLADYLIREYGLDRKCVPVGMSCGGLHAVYFAASHPEYVSSLYIDAPVMNLLSCPGAVGRTPNAALEELERDTGLSLKKLINHRDHPIDRAPNLLLSKIPIVMVAGGKDTVVPYDENGELLAKLYKNGGGELLEIVKPECNHHPHGLEDNTPIIDFVEKHYI